MKKSEKYVYSTDARYTAHFAATLRELMEQHGTTQREIAEFVGIRPQTLAQYTTGETQPNGDKLLKIAEYYNVTVDYLLTGTVIENIPVYEMLGLSENTVSNIKLVKDGYFEETPGMINLLDRLLADKDFYKTLETVLHYISDKEGSAEEWQRFCEWNATQAMSDFFMHFFAMLNAESKQDTTESKTQATAEDTQDATEKPQNSD